MRWFSKPKLLPVDWKTGMAVVRPASVAVDYEPAITVVGTEPGPMLTPTLESVIESCDRFSPADPLEFLVSTLMLSPAGIDVL